MNLVTPDEQPRIDEVRQREVFDVFKELQRWFGGAA